MPSLGATATTDQATPITSNLQPPKVGGVVLYQTPSVSGAEVAEEEATVNLHPSELLVPLGRITFDNDVLEMNNELRQRKWKKMLRHFQRW
jgi:hypothetical protein